MRAFEERLVDALNASAPCLVTSVGQRAGLFDAMADMLPGTSAQIAAGADLNERYVPEWLGAMLGPYVDEPQLEASVQARLLWIAEQYVSHLTMEQQSPRPADFVEPLGDVADAADEFAAKLAELPPWLPDPLAHQLRLFDAVDRYGRAYLAGMSPGEEVTLPPRPARGIDGNDPVNALVSTEGLQRWLADLAQAARVAPAGAGEDRGGSRQSVVISFGSAKGQLARRVFDLMRTRADLAADPATARRVYRPTMTTNGIFVRVMGHLHDYVGADKTKGNFKNKAELIVGYYARCDELNQELATLETEGRSSSDNPDLARLLAELRATEENIELL